MLKAYKYRLYPNKQQSKLLNRHFGCCRLIYNLGLEVKINSWNSGRKSILRFELIKQIVNLKQDCPWLYEISAQALQQSVLNLDMAYLNFFKYKKGFPKFKNRKGKQSFKIVEKIFIDFENKKLSIPKFREGIKFSLDRSFIGTINQCTISRVPSGKYFVSILVENNQKIPIKVPIERNTTLGIDLVINSLFVFSDGKNKDNPKFFKKSHKKLTYLQRQLSKNNHKGKRTKRKIILLHEYIANQRKDNLQKISYELIRDNQSIAIEDLNIKGMSKKCKPKKNEQGKYLHNGQNAKSILNRSILDAGWGMFIEMLKYKAEWNGKNILKIGRFEPSSKTCSNCGYIKNDLKSSDKEWKCLNCGAEHSRDINAAINIKNFALKRVCGVHTENLNSCLANKVEALTSEAQNN